MKANGGYQFVGSDLWVRYIWEGTSAKGCVEIEHWGFFVHFVLGFEENSIYTLTYVLAKILQNGAKFIQKLTPGFKNHMINFMQNTFLQLNYIQRIYLTLRSTTCVKIHQITYVIFETISHFSQHNSSVSF